MLDSNVKKTEDFISPDIGDSVDPIKASEKKSWWSKWISYVWDRAEQIIGDEFSDEHRTFMVKLFFAHDLVFCIILIILNWAPLAQAGLWVTIELYLINIYFGQTVYEHRRFNIHARIIETGFLMLSLLILGAVIWPGKEAWAALITILSGIIMLGEFIFGFYLLITETFETIKTCLKRRKLNKLTPAPTAKTFSLVPSRQPSIKKVEDSTQPRLRYENMNKEVEIKDEVQ